ncbi:histone deacetylase domain-containing protein [Melampsora americana]|nr:histone deacetylase domain-containing protein [Melampsora americana]
MSSIVHQTNPSQEFTINRIEFIIQDDCFKHTYQRKHQSMEIFERPERLRFINLGLSLTLTWILNQNQIEFNHQIQTDSNLFKLINSNRFLVSKSNHRIQLLDPSFRQIHPSSKYLNSITPSSSSSQSSKLSEESTYLDQLIRLCRHTSYQHQLGLSEVPDHLPQGDLYLSEGTEFAVLGAIGACYDAIDLILKPNSTSTKAFVNIRPPGHHCTNTEPMGFCWVNNVMVSCMYAYLNYSIDRICILDIDLHHGNGTQEIVWEINQRFNLKEGSEEKLKISYSSLHDLNSYPCESGEIDKIQKASLNLCISNSIQQFIQNLHLESWSDEVDFFKRLYPKIWLAFENHMIKFFEITQAKVEKSLIFVSAGFDACELETDSISRYGMKLPTPFYHRFSKDLSQFSNKYTNGRIISLLEGGYSEMTLLGSSVSYLLGLIDYQVEENNIPWDLNRLERIIELVVRKPNQEIKEEIELIENVRKIFTHLDGFEKSKIDMKSEIKKMGKMKTGMEGIGQSSRGMKLRSGRLASHSTEKDQTIDVMDGLFEKLKIGKESTENNEDRGDELGTPKKERGTPKKERGTPKKEKGTPKESKSTPKEPKSTPKESKSTPKEENKTQTQRLKLVWKSEGIN